MFIYKYLNIDFRTEITNTTSKPDIGSSKVIMRKDSWSFQLWELILVGFREIDLICHSTIRRHFLSKKTFWHLVAGHWRTPVSVSEESGCFAQMLFIREILQGWRILRIICTLLSRVTVISVVRAVSAGQDNLQICRDSSYEGKWPMIDLIHRLQSHQDHVFVATC